ncbi:MAG TPA: hypothetical protein VJN18_02910 [Polyangiaceae bacterium]|nr:hypothetical protein [Polyangiaceae bacterium]
MKTSEGWRACAGTSLTVGCLLALLTGCDTPGALRAYLGGHERPEIQAEPHPSASAAPLPPRVPASAPTVNAAPAEARIVSSEQTSVGAPTRVGRPYESVSPQVKPHPGFVPSVPGFPAPGQGGVSTPLAPIPGGVELGKPLPGSSGIVQKAPRDARHVSVGGAAVSGGNVSNAASVIAGLRAPLRACYAREAFPGSGSMRFALSVGPAGAANVTATKSSALSDRLLGCAMTAARDARFAPPDGGSATIQFPVTFVSESAGPAKSGPLPNPTPPAVPKGTTTL